VTEKDLVSQESVQAGSLGSGVPLLGNAGRHEDLNLKIHLPLLSCSCEVIALLYLYSLRLFFSLLPAHSV
jgi:hypothetical protein